MILGSFWHHFLLPFWDRFGIILGSFWKHFGSSLGSSWLAGGGQLVSQLWLQAVLSRSSTPQPGSASGSPAQTPDAGQSFQGLGSMSAEQVENSLNQAELSAPQGAAQRAVALQQQLEEAARVRQEAFDAADVVQRHCQIGWPGRWLGSWLVSSLVNRSRSRNRSQGETEKPYRPNASPPVGLRPAIRRPRSLTGRTSLRSRSRSRSRWEHSEMIL